jgi:hypothetical protein
MATKWRPGSAGEKEQKEARIIGVFVGLVSVLCLLLQLVIPSLYRDAVIQTEPWLRVLGAAFTVGSVVPIIKATMAGEEGVKGYLAAWAVFLALGMLLAGIDGL